MGGTADGDVYQIPNALVELVLRHSGWETMSLGTGLPFETLQSAIRQHHPDLFWLSVSHIQDEERWVAGWNELCAAAPPRLNFVVGGQALTVEFRQRLPRAAFCSDLRELETFVRSLGEATTP
jgi:methanogenic corrinoid protein MtbC1